ncbi:unnamed protein product [Parnassius apollo]|uniref:(apollo) hypothetical protein n=1 Tax=Parnassius apollo TaxID=110799 RepID=A0A8S3Y779_PARAO|nr:unnamed protein product [Parnassius apollo]
MEYVSGVRVARFNKARLGSVGQVVNPAEAAPRPGCFQHACPARRGRFTSPLILPLLSYANSDFPNTVLCRGLPAIAAINNAPHRLQIRLD